MRIQANNINIEEYLKHFGENISKVHKEGLCIGCSSCYGVCPNECITMALNAELGLYVPHVNENECGFCGLCVRICPGIDADFTTNLPTREGTTAFNELLGNYSGIYVGFSRNKLIHSHGASGGIVTQLLVHMLEKNLIDGAIVTRMDPEEPLKAVPLIAKTKDEIIEAQQSKYCPVPMGKIFKEIKRQSGRYALVGLPCHIKSLRKIQEYDDELKTKLPYVIGLFCSRTPSFNATEYVLERYGIKRDEVVSLEYRAGNAHIGFMNIKLKDGSEVEIPHLSFDYWGYVFQNFFMPTRCYLCADKVAALADISVGDNWGDKLRNPSGSSAFIVRNAQISGIINDMVSSRLIEVDELEQDALIMNQNLANKANIEPRKRLWKLFGGMLPYYGGVRLKANTLWETVKAVPLFLRVKIGGKKIPMPKMVLIARFFSFFDRAKKIIKTATFPFRLIKGALAMMIPVKPSAIKKKAKYKVLMIGGYGARDIGDEAMPHADIINLKRNLGNDLEIVMLSVNPGYTERFHKERSVTDVTELSPIPSWNPKVILHNLIVSVRSIFFIAGACLLKRGIHLRLWPSARAALLELHSSDVLFNVGGGNLNSIIPDELYKKGLTYIAADIFGKPIIVSGQTIGPLTGKIDRAFAKFCLNKAHMITFRDKDISYQRCVDAGIDKPILEDAADDAMTIPFIDRAEAQSLLELEAGQEWLESKAEHLIAFNFKGSLKLFGGLSAEEGIDTLIRKMAKIADSVIEKTDAKIVFIPTDYCADVDDRIFHRMIIDRMKNGAKVRAIEGEYDDAVLKGLLGLFDMAVGARYHFCVFAASMKTPYLGVASGIYQMTKLNGLSRLCGLPECFYEQDLLEATPEDVVDRCIALANNRGRIIEKLNGIVPVLESKSITGVKECVRVLRNN